MKRLKKNKLTFKKVVGKLSFFLRDGDKQLSSTRLAFLGSWFIIMIVWILACLKDHKLVPIDYSIISLLSVLMAGKTVQSFSENSTKITSVEQIIKKS
jgi:hypothetical protein